VPTTTTRTSANAPAVLQPRDLGQKRERHEEKQQDCEDVDHPLGNRRSKRFASRRPCLLVQHDDTRRFASAGRENAVEELPNDRGACCWADWWSRLGLKEKLPSDGSHPKTDGYYAEGWKEPQILTRLQSFPEDVPVDVSDGQVGEEDRKQ
jgi:hypothetical protein